MVLPSISNIHDPSNSIIDILLHCDQNTPIPEIIAQIIETDLDDYADEVEKTGRLKSITFKQDPGKIQALINKLLRTCPDFALAFSVPPNEWDNTDPDDEDDADLTQSSEDEDASFMPEPKTIIRRSQRKHAKTPLQYRSDKEIAPNDIHTLKSRAQVIRYLQWIEEGIPLSMLSSSVKQIIKRPGNNRFFKIENNRVYLINPNIDPVHCR